QRVYTDQDELFALEAEAQKLNHPVRENITQDQEPRLESEAEVGSWNPAHEIAGDVHPTESGPQGPGEQSVLLVVDQRTTMRFGTRHNTKSAVATKAAAFLAWRGLALGKAVGAIIFDDHKIFQVKPQCTRLRVRLILHALLNQNHPGSHVASTGPNHSRLNE